MDGKGTARPRGNTETPAAHHTTPTPPRPQYHVNPPIERHDATGALTIEFWPVCYECRERRWPDAFDGRFGQLTQSCAICLSKRSASEKLKVAAGKPNATAAIDALKTEVAVMKAAVEIAAAEVLDAHWGKQVFTSEKEVREWATNLAGAQSEFMFKRLLAQAAVARFVHDNGGGTAEGSE